MLCAGPNRTTFKEGSCVGESGYELNRQPSTIGYGPAYDTRIRKHCANTVIILELPQGLTRHKNEFKKEY
jgi:hypothetical protein